MFGPALRQLFSDLHQLSDRSAYEEALHNELSVLRRAFGASDPLDVSPSAFQTRHDCSYKVWIEQPSQPGVRLGEFEVGASGALIRCDPLGSNQPATYVDLGRNDIKRLRCSYDKCPNKRM
jgi:hypothetical protein